MDAIFGQDDILVINQKVAKENNISVQEVANLAKAGIVIESENGDYLYDIITKKSFMEKLKRDKKS